MPSRTGARSIRRTGILLVAAGWLAACHSAPTTATDGAGSGGSASGGAADGGATEASGDEGLLSWLGDLNPFRGETRAAVESGRVTERVGDDGWRQVTVDLDLSRGDGPKSLLCAVTRRVPPTVGAAAPVDLVTIVVRDDPRRMMLIDDGPAFLVVARERHPLDPLPPSGDSVKRAADELQCRRSYRVPEGLLDRLVEGAPVQLVVPVGGQEVTRTLPGGVCRQIEEAGHQRSGMASAAASSR